MCEFCIQHGAGKKWYLAAENYTDELARSEGRELFIKDIFKNYWKVYGKRAQMADIAFSLPSVREQALMKINEYFTSEHSGQVVPLEDVISICGLPGRISLIDCPCSKYLFGKNEKKCMLFGTTAEIADNIPEFSPVQDRGAEDAAELLKSLDASGMIHTVWTFKTPYIGVVCNCNNHGCVILHLKKRYKYLNVLRKGHEIASVDLEICNGCGNCQKICQFGAVVINGKKAEINHECYGCGVCRNFCSAGAIKLMPKI